MYLFFNDKNKMNTETSIVTTVELRTHVDHCCKIIHTNSVKRIPMPSFHGTNVRVNSTAEKLKFHVTDSEKPRFQVTVLFSFAKFPTWSLIFFTFPPCTERHRVSMAWMEETGMVPRPHGRWEVRYQNQQHQHCQCRVWLTLQHPSSGS